MTSEECDSTSSQSAKMYVRKEIVIGEKSEFNIVKSQSLLSNIYSGVAASKRQIVYINVIAKLTKQ